MKIGDKVTVDNGLINLVVLEKKEKELICRVLDGGKLGSRKHINLPGIKVNIPSITQKDLKDIKFGLEQDIDFVALLDKGFQINKIKGRNYPLNSQRQK